VIFQTPGDQKSRPANPSASSRAMASLQGVGPGVTLLRKWLPISTLVVPRTAAIGTPRRFRQVGEGLRHQLAGDREGREAKASRESKKRPINDTTIHTDPKSNDQCRYRERGRLVSDGVPVVTSKPHAVADPKDVMARKMLWIFCDVSRQIRSPPRTSRSAATPPKQSRPSRKTGAALRHRPWRRSGNQQADHG